MLANLSDTLIIVRFDDGAVGLTGWGVFFLVMLIVGLFSIGANK